MAKVILAKKEPEKLKEKEAVIKMPDFVDFVKQHEKMLGKTKLTTVNNLRTVVSAIGTAYDETFSPLTSVNLTKFRDRDYKTIEGFASVVVELFQKQYPAIFDRYIEHQIKKRNDNTETIYFVGPEEKLSIFKDFGFLVDTKKK